MTYPIACTASDSGTKMPMSRAKTWYGPAVIVQQAEMNKVILREDTVKCTVTAIDMEMEIHDSLCHVEHCLALRRE